MTSSVRERVVERLNEDLVGPDDDNEILAERPSDRYLLGILFPPGQEVPRNEDDAPREESPGSLAEPSAEAGEAPVFRTNRPSTFGLTFRVRGERPSVRVVVEGGIYERLEGAPNESWRRTPVEIAVDTLLNVGYEERDLPCSITLRLGVRVERARDAEHAVTVVVSNRAEPDKGPTWTEENSLFQAALTVSPLGSAVLPARPLFLTEIDEEDRSASLLYRSVREFAVGHGASAIWADSGDQAGSVKTSWLPSVRVPSYSALGGPEFSSWAASAGALASDLSAADGEQLRRHLGGLASAYRDWLSVQAERVPALEADKRAIATEHLGDCTAAADFIEEGIDFLVSNDVARRAFQLANKAMVMQATSRGELRWRPFQLAFQLICLPSIADGKHSRRSEMELLWFPTGGGKTEAYLGLIAFTILFRRLSRAHPDDGAGVAVLMRYTLRALTAQQFQRASALIAACEELRAGDPTLGDVPFSIGLWVGSEGTPNTIEEAAARPADLKVLPGCPRCGDLLTNPTSSERRQWCRNPDCHFHGVPIPVYVVDTDVYQVRPSLIVSTIDKFAQITRQPAAQALFSIDAKFPPPDLIVQDELHLISGPLGTIAGLYEIAIDAFCSTSGLPPKLVGSTATIRRAREQVRALFDREVRRFPPPGIDHDNSGFAVVDITAPGRLYLGVPSLGRSPKFALQALLASALQAAAALRQEVGDQAVDPFWTCVAYFNSLRELGGAVVLVEDDVRRSVERLALRRGETPRSIDVPSEITSRVPTSDIPTLLDQLGTGLPAADIDVVLASNMISVGLDVPRLGLMVVNGQPKTTAEYIQATSRVGRQTTPGLILVAYNVQRARDRSRYESFSTWHRALYRDVEPTSVTPFSARARDRALHAPLVALLRLGGKTKGDSPQFGSIEASDVKAAVETLLKRVGSIDDAELVATSEQLERIVDDWRAKKSLLRWWWLRQKPEQSALLVGAEDHAALSATGAAIDAWPTPNSMRDVEPTTRYRLVPSLRREDSDGA